ncbi:MAG: glycerol kinase GlpK [Verrucomicrobiales bacterium]
MSQHFILALDQGTTSSRAIVFDQMSRPVATAQKEHRQIYPRPGWVEHDATEIWNHQLAVAEEALTLAELGARDIVGIGITNQRETVVIWDRTTGAPLCNAIVWQDRRTAALCQEMQSAGLEPEFAQLTGLRLDPYFSGTKLRWLLDHIDGARERAEAGELCFGTIDSWLIWNLSGGETHVTDASNASRTLLCDIGSGQWSDWCLEQLHIPRQMLPEIVDSSGIAGKASVGSLAGIPIAGIAGDQQAALFGQACFEPGMAKNTYGTGCFLLLNTGSEAKAADHLLSTVAWRINGEMEYALEGSVFVGGAVVQWLRDELQLIGSAEECSTFAAQVEDSNGVFLVPAFAGLGAPHWDPDARGSMFGLTRCANRGHICRAALESIAFQSTDLIHAMEKAAGIDLSELRVDGGATSSDLLMQIQADILQAEVIRPACIETTALGAAYLAGLATKVWPDKETISQQWQIAHRFSPTADPERSADQLRDWHRAVERSKHWAKEC